MPGAELGPMITFFSTIAGAAVASAGFGIWFMNQFEKVQAKLEIKITSLQTKFNDKVDELQEKFNDKVDELQEKFQGEVAAHEKLNRERHADNIDEIRDISTSVTRLEAQIEYRLPPPRRG